MAVSIERVQQQVRAVFQSILPDSLDDCDADTLYLTLRLHHKKVKFLQRVNFISASSDDPNCRALLLQFFCLINRFLSLDSPFLSCTFSALQTSHRACNVRVMPPSAASSVASRDQQLQQRQA
jgi:hypothetical protein